MSCKLEPAIWSRDTCSDILCFDRCQLTIAWMSNIKNVLCKSRVHVSVNFWSMAAMLSFVVVVFVRTRPRAMPLALFTAFASE